MMATNQRGMVATNARINIMFIRAFVAYIITLSFKSFFNNWDSG